MKITGSVKQIGDTASFGANGFQKREVVISTVEQYPQHILIELHQDNVDLIDLYKIGDNVSVSFNVRGREWTNDQGKISYYNSIVGWRIEKFNS
jgi:hypothetical protein